MAKRKSCLAWPHRKKSWWRSLTAIHHALTALVHDHGDPDPEPSPPPRPARRPSVSYPSLLLLVSGAKPPAYLQAPLLLAAGGRAVGGVPALLRRRPAPRLLPGQDGGAVGGWMGFSKAWVRWADRSCESPHDQGEECFGD